VKITKAVITAAAKNQRNLPLQTLVDRDGASKSVLQIIVEESLRAGIEDICIIVAPGDEDAYAQAVGAGGGNLRFLVQPEPLGYGHAVYCARDFVAAEPFLHMVGDHVYISSEGRGCASQLVEMAQTSSCSVSAVQPTRESLLPLFGAVGGQRVKGTTDIFPHRTSTRKATPPTAEQTLMVRACALELPLLFRHARLYAQRHGDSDEHVRDCEGGDSTIKWCAKRTNIALSPVLKNWQAASSHGFGSTRSPLPVDARSLRAG
jgi:UTP-glucose-1-phosphate uridylyltransferase